MNERDMWWKIVVVGCLCALGFASIWPFEQKMKMGIDLYGGYSLLYEIDDTGVAPDARRELSEKVMRVLRERIDPQGVFNLVWRPVGYNRLEIQMPRPSEDVRKARHDFEELQEQIQATALRRTDVLRALEKPAADRPAYLEKLARGMEIRTPLANACATAYDAWQTMKRDYTKREAEATKDNLTRDQVMEAVKKPANERNAALEALVRGLPQRKALLETAAKAWEEFDQAKSAAGATPPADKTAELNTKETAFINAVAKVMELNVDPNKFEDGPTIDKVLKLEMEFDAALAALMATNLDIGRLQTVLDSKAGTKNRTEAMARLTLDYPHMTVQIEGLVKANDRLNTKRKGEGRLEDPADLQRMLKGAGVLEFRILAANETSDISKFETYRESLRTRGPRRAPGEENYQWFEIQDPTAFLKIKDRVRFEQEFEQAKLNNTLVVDRFGDKYYVLSYITPDQSMTHRVGESTWALTAARFTRDDVGLPAIGFSLNEAGGDKFATLTRINKNRQLAIFIDDQCVSHATIQAVIRTDGIIHGSFTPQEVQEMVRKLDAGSLPRKLKDPPISVRAIGPSLGEANRTAGLTAAKWGLMAVVAFMLVYYRYAGTVALFAVGMNLLFTLAVMAIMGATLTLPGIAGLVLALGMSVDANVLINERIREELQKGTAMRMAIRLGYERAFSAILDSNLTTLLTCLILYVLGSEEIKGFGLTLGIGVFINLFTAYFVTKMFFETMVMPVIPREITRLPGIFAAGIAGFGGLLYGAGHLWNAPELRDQSVLMGFGKAVVWMAPGVLVILVLMFIMRGIHQSFQSSGRPRLPMMNLVGTPRINWIGLKPMFFTFSIGITVIGLAAFFSLGKQNLYDIEFLGGTAAQIDLVKPGSLDQTQIGERLEQSATKLRGLADSMDKATATAAGPDTFTVNCPGVPAVRLEPVIRDVMKEQLSEVGPIAYSDPGAESVSIRTRTEAKVDEAGMKTFLASMAERLRRSAESIGRAQVQSVQSAEPGAPRGASFEIVTLETNKDLVVAAIMDHLKDDLSVQQALTFNLMEDKSSGNVPYFAVRSENARELNLPITPEEVTEIDLAGWRGGVAMILDKVSPPQKLESLQSRLRAMRLQPGFESHGWRQSAVFGLKEAAGSGDAYERVMVVVADENFPMLDEQGGLSSAWVTDLAEQEVKLIQDALQRQTSLSQITQFDKQVSGEAQTDAYIAITLSWLIIILYVWFRFGNVRWGMAAVVALIHDICVALGFIGLAHYAAGTPIGRALMLEPFRIDLAMVAAVMTIIGYSVNDTIVIFDRIRENRGRLKDVNPELVNTAISQTLGRTLLTGTTTFATILIMYIFGGPGIHGFNYAMFIGILTGTYSSFGVASQLLVRRGRGGADVGAMRPATA